MIHFKNKESQMLNDGFAMEFEISSNYVYVTQHQWCCNNMFFTESNK